ncbi:MAG TPA: transaldolase [Solirubrobacteraceae bacterium]|jgi:transaldolase|nr:transaldolase [Solirubrobacteraceae bacterium]
MTETTVSTTISISRLEQLSRLGQSVWVDYLSRDSIHSGHLQSLIDSDAVVGATSNPSIFQKAMTAGHDYDEQLRQIAADEPDPKVIFWALAEQDVRDACDLFRPIWEISSGRDGYVSLEVDPNLAYDSEATFQEAIRLHTELERPNLMVKIPATKPGLTAIEDCIADGRSINVTLIFSLDRYAAVAEAYVRGLERLVAAGGDPGSLASVASFFVSRIDTETDRRLAEVGDQEHLHGLLGIANARLAYESYQSIFSGPRWEALADKGAMPQRLLWASTSVKDLAYIDTRYVDELIGADTVDTMPEETIRLYQDHGRPRPRITAGLPDARRLIDELRAIGVEYDDVTDTLERDGVKRFADDFSTLLDALRNKRAQLAA